MPTIPSTGYTIGGAATSTTQPLTVSSSQASMTSDYVPIYSQALAATVAVNIRNLLGISAQVVSISDPQTLSSKTLDNSNSYSAKDTSFTLQNATSTTKRAQFLLSGITAGQTRIFTLPDYNATIATLGGTETLTNKTLTTPTLTNPAITGGSLAIDAIIGQSVSTNGTIYGMSVTGGLLASAAILGKVNTAAVQDNAITAPKLSTDAIELGYAQITSTFTSSSTSAAQVTGLTATVTVPSGGRALKILVFGANVFTSTAADVVTITIWRGTVGSGTQIGESSVTTSSALAALPLFVMARDTPSPGTVTYNVGIATGTGTHAANISAAATFPASLLVEVR